MSKVENGNEIKVHYRGTFNDGIEFDNSQTRGEPLGFTVGAGQMIEGFNNACIGMSVGEKKTIILEPDEAYGPINPDAIQSVTKEIFPNDFNYEVGNQVQGQTPEGQVINAIIAEVADTSVMLDMNHPLAGKSLTFEIEVVDIDS
jgi:peptidylprolyl isomerase